MVELAKHGDAVREIRTRAGGDGERGPLRMIGGMPVRRVDGPVIKIAGPRINGERVMAVLVEKDSGRIYGSTLVTEKGTEHPALQSGVPRFGRLGHVRDAWIRYTLASGIYAGMGRMR